MIASSLSVHRRIFAMSATGPNTGMPSNSCPMSDLSSSRKAATLPNIFLRLMSEAMEMPANPAPIMYKCLSDLFTVFHYSTAVRVLQFDNAACTGAGRVRGRVHERSGRKTTILHSEEGVAQKTGALCARTLERGGDFPPCKKI